MLLLLTINGGSAGADLLDVPAERKKVIVKAHFYQSYFTLLNKKILIFKISYQHFTSFLRRTIYKAKIVIFKLTREVLGL